MQVAEPRELLQCLQDLVLKEKLPLEAVLPLFTQNPAKRLKLHDKGQVANALQQDLPYPRTFSQLYCC